jgi:hypothetical protein
MGGHAGHRPTRHVEGRLEANIVAFGDGADVVVLISLDTLFAGSQVTEAAVSACRQRFGIGPERVLVLASHTHSSPMLDASKPLLGRADPEEVSRWADGVSRAILGVETKHAGAFRAGCGRSDLSVNRRLPWNLPTLVRLLGKTESKVYLCDNPAGPRDPRIRTCVWLSPENTPLAAFWSFGCHPVSFPETETASPDFVGVVREALRQRLGSELPVLFGPGCMGDVRPLSPRPWKIPSRIAQLAVYGPSPLPFDRSEWDLWAAALAGQVNSIDENAETKPIKTSATARPMVRLPMSTLFDGFCPTAELNGKSIGVPGLGRVIALSCEPVTAITGLVANSGNDLVLGYEGDVFGYLPTDAMVAEGGYEAQGFLASFGLQGRFRPGLDAKVSRLGLALRT